MKKTISRIINTGKYGSEKVKQSCQSVEKIDLNRIFRVFSKMKNHSVKWNCYSMCIMYLLVVVDVVLFAIIIHRIIPKLSIITNQHFRSFLKMVMRS